MRGLRRCAERPFPTWPGPQREQGTDRRQSSYLPTLQDGTGGVQFFFKPGGNNQRGAFVVRLFKGRVILHAVKEFGNGAVGIDNAFVGNELLFRWLLAGIRLPARGLWRPYRPAGTCLQFFSCSFPFLAAVMDRGGDNQLHNGNSDQEDSEFFKHD